jgi:tetraacyldisaccharide 4'-kinase
MKLGTPRWWYVREGAPAPITRALLRPISWIWTAVGARKLAAAQPYDPGVPVICVGNLTMGGAGKTPVARAVLARLRAWGVEAHGLSRGYGGRLAGPLKVDPAIHAAADVGDEPLMLAADGAFWIARDRAAGAKAAAEAGARALVLDDGHQNFSLSKTLTLVVVDGETRGGEWPFGDGAVFPSGPLREPLAAGLKRTDAVVLMLPADVAQPDSELMAVFADKPILITRLLAPAPPPSGPQLGFAGVGKPWKVERALKAAGCDLVDFASFPDHAGFSESTLKALQDRADLFSAGLVTTEKDWVRLPPAWRAKVKAWPVRAVFENEAELDGLLRQALGQPIGGTPAPPRAGGDPGETH